ncbi:MAG: hypothetical protein R3D30_11610 [Hyphomicrobiales bacterium]
MNLDTIKDKGLAAERSVLARVPPRIYVLYGSAAGALPDRAKHLARVVGLGFDWVCYVPPPGRPDKNDIAAFAKDAAAAGLRPMLQTKPLAMADFATLTRSGINGFIVSDAATRKAAGWQDALAALRKQDPQTVFIADTLGRPWEEIMTLARAGFDYLINSAAWWDLRETWFLRQHQELSRLVPTLATPEPLHGTRLAHRLTFADPAARRTIYRGRYLLAAMASSGIICPMGFELASAVLFDGPATRSSDWDFAKSQAPFDLSDDIAAINRLKRKAAVLEGGGRLAARVGSRHFARGIGPTFGSSA